PCAAAAAMGSRHFPARTVLFERESSGVTYRVPALLYLPCVAKLLAFAEERLSADDAHANLLVLRRGSVYGTYVEEDLKQRGQGWREHPYRLEGVGRRWRGVCGDSWAAPGSVAVLPHRCRGSPGDPPTRGMAGQGGGPPLPQHTLTPCRACSPDWATFALGPGHGIQLRSGRLLVPAYSYHIDCKQCFGQLCKTTPHSFAFYSDDHGRAWRFGEFIPNLQSGECQLVSVDEEDGSNVLYCNARSPLGFRVQALSTDDGAAFQGGQLVQRLVEPPHGCHGSVIGFPAPLVYGPAGPRDTGMRSGGWGRRLLPGRPRRAGDAEPREDGPGDAHGASLGRGDSAASPAPFFQAPTWILYSHPTSAMSRVNMGVHLSTFPRDAESWTEPWVIYEGPSAYSDLACLQLPQREAPLAGGTATAFACLYENGLRSPYEQISFSMFTLHDVLQNIPLTAAGPRGGNRSRRRRRKRSCFIS
ncbi:NEUR4 protein, partial [Calcarius ornatus]|nr:NEUR4 protein [Calcarius ornatus]